MRLAYSLSHTPMERRQFFKHATALGASLGLGGSLAAQTAHTAPQPRRIGPNERINLALIGPGSMGLNHMRTLIGSDECQLLALCDVDTEALKKAEQEARKTYAEKNGSSTYRGLDTYADYRELLLRDDIDGIVIATPDHWHVPLTKAAMLAGKDVYVEKPLSLTIEEGRQLVALERTMDRIVQVGSQQRSWDRFLIACAAVLEGFLGDIHHAEVFIITRGGRNEPWTPQPIPAGLNYDMWVGPAAYNDYHPDRLHYNFRYVSDYAAGDITNWGAHHVDIAQFGLGQDGTGPVSVVGRGRRHPVGSIHSAYFGIDVDYTYADGKTMKLRSGTNERHGTQFFGSKGSLFVSREMIETNPRELLRSFPRHLEERLRKTKGSHLSNWFQCMRTRRKADLHAPLEIGHRSVTVCHLATLAMELERPLNWDPAQERFRDDGGANALLSRPTRDGWDA